MDFTLSTHDEFNQPKRQLKGHTFLEYLLLGFIFLVIGIIFFYFFYLKNYADLLGPFIFIPYLLIIFGFIVIILGIRNLRHKETININSSGVTIFNGNKTKSASWSNILEVKSWRTFRVTGGYPIPIMFTPLKQIRIQTTEWKYKISWGNFSEDELKELFKHIAFYAQKYQIKIFDELKWLPSQIEQAQL